MKKALILSAKETMAVVGSNLRPNIWTLWRDFYKFLVYYKNKCINQI